MIFANNSLEDKQYYEQDRQYHERDRNKEKQYYEKDVQYCEKHNKKVGDFYCLECNTTNICLQCIIAGLHKNHNLNDLSQSHGLIQKKLDKQLDSYRSQQQDFEQKNGLLAQVLDKHKQHFQEQLMKYESIFKQMYKSLKKKEEYVKDEIKNIYNNSYENIVKLKMQIESQIHQQNSKIKKIEEMCSNENQDLVQDFMVYQQLSNKKNTISIFISDDILNYEQNYDLELENIQNLIESIDNVKIINRQKDYSQINPMSYNNQTFVSEFNEDSNIMNNRCSKCEKGKSRKTLSHFCGTGRHNRLESNDNSQTQQQEYFVCTNIQIKNKKFQKNEINNINNIKTINTIHNQFNFDDHKISPNLSKLMQNIEEQKLQRKNSSKNLNGMQMFDKLGSHLSELDVKEKEKSTKQKIESMFKSNNERRRLNSNKSQRNTLLNKEMQSSHNNLKTDTPGLKQNPMYSRQSEKSQGSFKDFKKVIDKVQKTTFFKTQMTKQRQKQFSIS